MIGERFFQKLSGVTTPSQWFLNWAGVVPSSSGVTVNSTTALTYSAVWVATRILSETIASLPLKVYKVSGNHREEARYHHWYRLLHDQPNGEMDSFIYRETSMVGLVNGGNWYSEILRSNDGQVRELIPLHVSKVNPKRDDETGEVYYEVQEDLSGPPRIVRRHNMLHIAGPMSDEGLVGKGVITQARESIGMGLATEKYGATFFGNGARPGGVLEHPGRLSDDGAKGMQKMWEDAHRGVGNSNRTAILREGTTYKTIGIPPEEAQFLETRVHNISEIARWYRLPPHMLADLSRAHFTNIEHESLNFVKYSIAPWVSRIESAINRQLLNNSKTYYAEFNLDGLLRGDKASRTEANMTEFMHGKLTLNEWRKQDNQNPIKSKYGDEHFVPLNLVPLDNIEDVPNKSDDPEPEREKEPSGDSAPESPKQNSVALQASDDAIMDARRRLLQIEINALRRYAKTPDKFLGKVDGFYLRHNATTTHALRPLCRIRNELSEYRYTDDDIARMVLSDIGKHQCEILQATECKPAELPGAIETLIKSWLDEPEDTHANPEN